MPEFEIRLRREVPGDVAPADGEPIAVEMPDGSYGLKIGDGSTVVDDLPLVTGGGGGGGEIPPDLIPALEQIRAESEEARDASQTAAGEASLAADAAGGSAGTADAKAAAAALSASQASQFASDASTYRNDAGTAAGVASGAAGTAAEHRDAAQTAKTGAEGARDASVAARDAAVVARDAAAGSATAAGESATAAAGSATSAASAKTAAETARDGAQGARTAAETARDATEGAKTSAETARDGATGARTAAESARDAAAGSATAAGSSASAAAASAADALEAASQTAQVFVYHGDNANYPRPSVGERQILWVGTVIPANRAAHDLYLLSNGTPTDPTEPTFIGAFDTFAAPHRALSLRRLLGSYTGALIRVRRSTDNAEQDIAPAANGDLDTAALLAFAGSGSAYVTTWYDQSGNGRHMTQATVAAQPRIVNAGALDVLAGKAAILFDGVDDHLFAATSGLYAAGAASLAAVMAAAAASNSVLFQESATGDNASLYRIVRSSTANWNVQSNGPTGTSNYATSSTGSDVFDGNAHHLFYAEGANLINTWKDGTAKHANVAAPRTSPPNIGQTVIGANRGLSALNNFLNGRVQELVTWASDRTAERAAISAAQRNYWGTP